MYGQYYRELGSSSIRFSLLFLRAKVGELESEREREREREREGGGKEREREGERERPTHAFPLLSLKAIAVYSYYSIVLVQGCACHTQVHVGIYRRLDGS